MTVQMKLIVPAEAMTGIDGGVWSFFSHMDITFGFDESVILITNERNIACMI